MVHMSTFFAVFNPETPSVLQKRHPYTANSISETPGGTKMRSYKGEMY